MIDIKKSKDEFMKYTNNYDIENENIDRKISLIKSNGDK